MESENQSKDDDKSSQMFSSLSTKSCSCSNDTEVLMKSKIYEKLGCLSVEVEALKTDNKVLTERNNTLVANNREMQARLEAMEQKMKVAELEKKLAEQGIHNLVAMKVNEAIGQLRTELFKLNNEQVAKIIDAKMNEVTGQLEEKQSKCISLEMTNLAQQLDQGRAELERNVTSLQSYAINDMYKLEEVSTKLASLETKENETSKEIEDLSGNLFKFMWSKNHWYVSSQNAFGHTGMRVSANGLKATAMSNHWVYVRAQQQISSSMLASFSGLPLVYFEVNLTPNFQLGICHTQSRIEWLYPTTRGINWCGDYWKSGNKIDGYVDGDRYATLIGSGILLARDGRLYVFFTKNGKLEDGPIVLPKNDSYPNQQELLFCPVVSLFHQDTIVEANFGADPGKKPFLFDINAHTSQLFR